MREFMNIVENAQGLPPVLYHGTDLSNVETIMQHGLSPDKDLAPVERGPGDGCVYLTDDLELAHEYAYGEHHSNREHSGAAVFAVNTSHLDPGLFRADKVELGYRIDGDDYGDMPYDDPARYTWQESLELCLQVGYAGTIPPSAIKRIA